MNSTVKIVPRYPEAITIRLIESRVNIITGTGVDNRYNLVRFITGLEVAEVAAEVGSIVPGRLVHDYAGALLRFDNGARGSFWVTQAAAGVENCLRIRVSGTKGSLE